MGTKRTIQERAQIFAALAEPMRLRIIDLLTSNGEASATEAAETLGISVALFCHHAKILTDARLLRKNKRGQATYYKVDEDAVPSLGRR